MLKETAKELAHYVRRVYFMPKICISCHIHLQSLMICYFIPASNEPSSRACTDIWRMPRGVLSASGACTAPTEAERRPNTKVSKGHLQLCCVTSLMSRQLAARYLTPGNNITRPSLAAVIPESEDFYGEKQRRNEGR